MGQWATNSTRIPDGSGVLYHQINTWLISQDIVNNTSTIGWSIAVKGNVNYGSIYSDESYAEFWMAGSLLYNKPKGEAFVLGEYHSGQHIIYHNNDGTGKYALAFSAQMWGGEPRSTGTVWNALPTIPRKASFTWTGGILDKTKNIYFKYNNPAGNAVESLQFAVRLNDDPNASLPWKDVPKTGSEFNYNLTDENIAFLRSKMGSYQKKKLVYYLKTRIGGVDNYDIKETTFTLTNASAPPISGSLSYEETTKNLPDNKILQNKNNVKITFNGSASGKDGATIKTLQLKINNKIINNDPSNKVFNVGNIDAKGTIRAELTAIDSRGFNSATKILDLYIYEYKNPFVKIEANRKNNYEEETAIVISGKIQPININGEEFNEIKEIKYSFGGNTYPVDHKEISKDGTFKTQTLYRSVPNTKSETFKVFLNDKFSTAVNDVSINKGQPIFRISTYDNKLYNNEKRVVTEDEITPWKDGKKRFLLYSKLLEPYREFTNVQALYEVVLESAGWQFLDGSSNLSNTKSLIDTSKYKIEMKLEADISTGGNFKGWVSINNTISAIKKVTWGAKEIMSLSSTDFFDPEKVEFIPLKYTKNYKGIQLILHSEEASGGRINFKNVMMHVYAVEK